MNAPPPRARWLAVFLAATLAGLLGAIAAGYMTRIALAQAAAWVTHTDDVKLAIAHGQLALARGDAVALRRAEERVRALTVDNPRQQRNVDRALLLTEQGESAPLEELFVAMEHEEDVLRGERLHRIDAAATRSTAGFVIAVSLTIAFGAGALLVLAAQQKALARHRALLEAVVESVDEGIVAVDASRNIVTINAAARALWGGAPPRDRWPDDWSSSLQATYESGSAMAPQDGPLARALRGESVGNVVYRLVPARDATPGDSAARDPVWLAASARPIRDASGDTVAAVTTLRDITEDRARAAKLQDESVTDELTGLLNRRGFLAQAAARIAEARRTKAPIALLYADVNGLKRINDELGHEQGDHAIVDAARVLRAVLRGGDIVARLGGDEFVALLPNVEPSSSDALLERLTAAVRGQAQESRPFRLSISFGVTFMDWAAGRSLDELLADADRKMYERKRARAGQSMPVIGVASRVESPTK